MRRAAQVCASATEPFPHPRSIAGRVLKQKAAKEADQQKASASRGHVPDKPGAGKHDLGSGAIVHYHPEAFKGNAALLFTQLVQDIPWLHRTIKVMGRPVLQPRLVCYMADDASLRYTYSGTQWDPVAWTSCVLQIKEHVEALAQTTFNSCLLNYYRDGKDHLSWHSDSEPLYGPTPTIASASFGSARDFMLRSNGNHRQKYCFALGNGAVLVMAGTVQQGWMHSIPKRKLQQGGRVSLTFRNVVNPER